MAETWACTTGWEARLRSGKASLPAHLAGGGPGTMYLAAPLSLASRASQGLGDQCILSDLREDGQLGYRLGLEEGRRSL